MCVCWKNAAACMGTTRRILDRVLDEDAIVNVKILLFASFNDAAGLGQTALFLPLAQATVADVRAALVTQHPALAKRLDTAVAAVNQEFAFPQDAVHDGDEVAFFPPVSVFSGMVRGETRADDGIAETDHLEYEAYAPMAVAKMRQVATEIRAQFPDVQGIAIVQRVGRLAVGQNTILIACASGHRDGGCFEAARYGIDRLKQIGLGSPQPAYSLTEEKVRFAYETEVFYSMLDSAELCQFVYGPTWTLYDGKDTVQMINSVTGWDMTIEELMEVGRRRLNLFRVFNAREGLTRNADKLPKKFFKQLQGTGPTAGFTITHEEIDSAIDSYYKMAGWTNDGVPTRETLKKHDVEWAAEYLPA